MPNVLGILRFSLPEEKTRSLNATQLGDYSETKIVLGTTAAKLKVLSHSKAVRQFAPINGLASCAITVQGEYPNVASVCSVYGYFRGDAATVKAHGAGPNDSGLGFWGPALPFGGPRKTTTQTVFIGTINVATGKYKSWFGKTGVLKYDTTTGKALLRIYDDE